LAAFGELAGLRRPPNIRRPPSKNARRWGVLDPYFKRTSLEGRQVNGVRGKQNRINRKRNQFASIPLREIFPRYWISEHFLLRGRPERRIKLDVRGKTFR
jgi:hypothetical protein